MANGPRVAVDLIVVSSLTHTRAVRGQLTPSMLYTRHRTPHSCVSGLTRQFY